MIEESVESFILEYKPYAAAVEILPRVEGSPLLEFLVAGKVFGVLERTNPYAAHPGRAQLILNPTATKLEPTSETSKSLTQSDPGHLKAVGRVLARQPEAIILDAGVPLVVTLLEPLQADIDVGDWVELGADAPVHGFYVPTKRSVFADTRASDSDSI